MTIDEAIKKLKSDAIADSYNFQGYSMKQKQQIAEWLEELRHYQLGECMNDCEHYDNCSNYIYSKGYNKAIDDFVKEIEAEYDNDGCPNVTDYLDYQISIRDLHKIAEQLKGGAE